LLKDELHRKIEATKSYKAKAAQA
jgi:hypothetical protein